MNFAGGNGFRRSLAQLARRGALEEGDVFSGSMRFIIAGLFSTALYFVVVLIIHWAGVTARLASAGALILCWAVSYIVQSRFTFRQEKTKSHHVTRFLVMSIIGLAISETAMILIYERIGFPLWVAAGVVCISIPIFNFIIMNFWIFKR